MISYVSDGWNIAKILNQLSNTLRIGSKIARRFLVLTKILQRQKHPKATPKHHNSLKASSKRLLTSTTEALFKPRNRFRDPLRGTVKEATREIGNSEILSGNSTETRLLTQTTKINELTREKNLIALRFALQEVEISLHQQMNQAAHGAVPMADLMYTPHPTVRC